MKATMSGNDPAASHPTALAQAEARVEAHSTSLKKELGVRDLALTQILFIVGLTWIGVAGESWAAPVGFCVLALVLFFFPPPPRGCSFYLPRALAGGGFALAKLWVEQKGG